MGADVFQLQKQKNDDSLRHCFDHSRQVGPQVKSVKSLQPLYFFTVKMNTAGCQAFAIISLNLFLILAFPRATELALGCLQYHLPNVLLDVGNTRSLYNWILIYILTRGLV